VDGHAARQARMQSSSTAEALKPVSLVVYNKPALVGSETWSRRITGSNIGFSCRAKQSMSEILDGFWICWLYFKSNNILAR
jgi:hypothetical protein